MSDDEQETRELVAVLLDEARRRGVSVPSFCDMVKAFAVDAFEANTVGATPTAALVAELALRRGARVRLESTDDSPLVYARADDLVEVRIELLAYAQRDRTVSPSPGIARGGNGGAETRRLGSRA